jgi:hypothetical protein
MRDACMTSALLFMQHMYQMICENENVQQTRTIKDVHKMFTSTRERMHEVSVRDVRVVLIYFCVYSFVRFYVLRL